LFIFSNEAFANPLQNPRKEFGHEGTTTFHHLVFRAMVLQELSVPSLFLIFVLLDFNLSVVLYFKFELWCIFIFPDLISCLCASSIQVHLH